MDKKKPKKKKPFKLKKEPRIRLETNPKKVLADVDWDFVEGEHVYQNRDNRIWTVILDPEAPSINNKPTGPGTKLYDYEEKTFRSWYDGVSKSMGLNPDPDHPEHYYDYRGYWKEYGNFNMQPGDHFDSKYKYDKHPNRFIDTDDGKTMDTKTGKVVERRIFRMGGEIPPKQLPEVEIYDKDYKNRLKAYEDSLYAHDIGNYQVQAFIDDLDYPEEVTTWRKHIDNLKTNTNPVDWGTYPVNTPVQRYGKQWYNIADGHGFGYDDVATHNMVRGIAPTDFTALFTYQGGNGGDYVGETIHYFPYYKKPTKPQPRYTPPSKIQGKEIKINKDGKEIKPIPASSKLGRADQIYFNYSKDGQNNYVNWGDNRGMQRLTNEEADAIYTEWKDNGILEYLGRTGQANVSGKTMKKRIFKTGGIIPPATTPAADAGTVPAKGTSSKFERTDGYIGNFLSPLGKVFGFRNHDILAGLPNPKANKALRNLHYGFPVDTGLVRKSDYKPTIAKDKDADYYSITDDEIETTMRKVYEDIRMNNFETLPAGQELEDNPWYGLVKTGDNRFMVSQGYRNISPMDRIAKGDKNRDFVGLGRAFTASIGEDKKGKYISYYAKSNPDYINFVGLKGTGSKLTKSGKELELYDRIYIKDVKADKNRTPLKYVPAIKDDKPRSRPFEY